MKAAGETLFFIKIEGEPKKQDTTGIETFRQKDCCRTELWRDLYKKTPKGQFLEIRNHLAEAFKIYLNRPCIFSEIDNSDEASERIK